MLCSVSSTLSFTHLTCFCVGSTRHTLKRSSTHPLHARAAKKKQVEVWRDGRAYSQSFSRGAAAAPMAAAPAAPGAPRGGTRVEFLYDAAVFAPGVAWDPELVAARLRELAFLNPSATLRLRVTGGGKDGGGPEGAAAARKRARRAAGAASSDEDEAGAGAGAGGSAGGGAISLAAIDADAAHARGVVDAEGWRVFRFEGGLREYVAW